MIVEEVDRGEENGCVMEKMIVGQNKIESSFVHDSLIVLSDLLGYEKIKNLSK